MSQLGCLHCRIPPSILLRQPIEKPLHLPLDFQRVRLHRQAPKIGQPQAITYTPSRKSGTYSGPIPKDQAGSVLEWLETNEGINRFIRGGSWGNNHEVTWSHYRLAIETSRSDSLTGFRIASVPEPGGIALVFVGALAILFRRRAAAS
jgi:hypothetical protein